MNSIVFINSCNKTKYDIYNLKAKDVNRMIANAFLDSSKSLEKLFLKRK